MSLNIITTPITVTEASWPEDETFLRALQASWVAQYSDYLGQAAAVSLIERLLVSGELYPLAEQPLVVAYSGEQLVGIGCLRPLQKLSLITMLEVLQSSRHQGVGKALMAALEQRSERLLAHVSIHRPLVRAFYQGLDFNLLERIKVDHYGHLLEFDVMVK